MEFCQHRLYRFELPVDRAGVREKVGERFPSQRTPYQEAVQQTITLFGLKGIVGDCLIWSGEFVFNIGQKRQEILDGTDTRENVRVCAPLDQFFQFWTSPVEN